MSTLASLAGMLGQMPQIRPWDVATRSQTEADTGLIKLADLKRQQASEALLMERIQNDPELRQRLFGDGSIIGSLQTAPGGMPGAQPAPGPITQSPLGGGAAQQIPASPDLSRFAQVPPQGGGPIPPDVMAQTMPTVTPPGGVPTLATLGPQGGMPGPGPQQPQRNPLLEMAARDPRAALMLQQQMQTQQDRQLTMQKQGIENRIKIVDYLARMAQGTSDQDSWKQFIEEADRVQPGAGGRVPQMYSKDARDRIVAQGLDAKESMTLQVAEMKARADQTRAGLAGRTDAVNTELEIMGLAPASVSSLAQQGDPQAKAQLAEATNRAEQRQVRIHKAGVTPQIVTGEGGIQYSIDPHTLERRAIPGGTPGAVSGPGAGGAPGATTEPMRAPMSDTEKKAAGYTSRMQEGQRHLNELEASGDYTSWKAPLTQLPGGRLLLTEKQKAYEAAKGVFLAGLLRYDSAGQITEKEWKQYGDLYFPQPDDPPSTVELKRKYREQSIQTHQEMIGRPIPGQSQAQPTSQAPAASGPATFDRDDFLKWRQGAGKSGNPTQADVEAYFQAKGLKKR